MTLRQRLPLDARTRAIVLALPAIVLLVALTGHRPANAQVTAETAATSGPAWSTLSTSQKRVLQPLERDWNRFDAPRKIKWIEVADRFPKLPASEQERIQARMAEWSRLSPAERGKVRQNFKDAQQISPEERKARWEAYSALPPDQRQELAAKRAEPPPRPAPARRTEADGASKSNIVPNPATAARPRAIGPTLSQARPGATTNSLAKRPAPPPHQQTGQPKIAASRDVVDPVTLLPKRAAVARTSEARASEPSPP